MTQLNSNKKSSKSMYFFDMVETLRRDQEVLLYANRIASNNHERNKVTELLRQEFEEEALEHPFESVPFHGESATWAAEFVYIAAQLILYRNDDKKKLKMVLPVESFEISPQVALSVDLMLRFLPAMLVELRLIDPEDELIELLENKLHKWHYSAVPYKFLNPVNPENFDLLFASDCMRQLYINRVIEYKNSELASLPVINEGVIHSLGMHAGFFWNDFNPIKEEE